jgi:hypothetical protein
MSSVDDAIFLMDGENMNDTKKVCLIHKKKEKCVTKSSKDKSITSIVLEKSQPIDIIKPKTNKIDKTEFFPSSPYTKSRFSAPAIL